MLIWVKGAAYLRRYGPSGVGGRGRGAQGVIGPQDDWDKSSANGFITCGGPDSIGITWRHERLEVWVIVRESSG